MARPPISLHARHWRVATAVVLAVVTIIAFSVPASRYRLLRHAGWMLVSRDRPARADAIVIAVDADGAGVLEAVDLVRGGLASHVAIFSDPPGRPDREFLRRGLPYYDAAALSREQLRALGVRSVETISRPVDGTTDAVDLLPDWCRAKGYRTIILITAPDHSRRTRRMLRRAMRDRGTRVMVVYSPYARFDPASWWRSREGIRTEIVESEKLLLDIIRYPFS